MAKNDTNISLVDVHTSGKPSKIDLIKFEITDSGSAVVKDLGIGDFGFEGSPAGVGEWTFNTTENTATDSGIYAFKPDTTFTPTQGDYLYAQVTKDANTSDKLLLDYMQGYTDSEATYTFKLPDVEGNYRINLDTVDEEDFSSITSSMVRLNATISTADSEIHIQKDYLTHFVEEDLGVNIVIGKGDSSTLEVSMVADKI